MEAEFAAALAEGESKANEEEALEGEEEKESPPKVIGVVEKVSPSKKGKHDVLHYDGYSYNFRSAGKKGVLTYLCIKKNTASIKCLGFMKCLKEDGIYKVTAVRHHTSHGPDNYVAKRKEFNKELIARCSHVDAKPSKIVTQMQEKMTKRERLKYPLADSLRRIGDAQKRKLLPSAADNPKSKTLIGRQMNCLSFACIEVLTSLIAYPLCFHHLEFDTVTM